MRMQFLAGMVAALFGLGLFACGDDDGGNNQNNNNSAATCGDNVAAGTETCDGMDLRGNDCLSIDQGFTGGTLACSGTCDGWDTAGCTGGATCGDSTVEGNEICDLANLNGNDCLSIGQGFIGGTLGCNADCISWDTSLCVSATCGDDTAEGNEVCDGVDLDSNDCTTIGQGFIGGTLGCNGTCDGWDVAACTSPTCGDSTVEGNELCDLGNLDGNDCTTIPGGFTGGTLACNGTCDGWDTTGCTGAVPVCGDGNVDTTEDCDLSNLDGQDCTTVPGGYTGGTLACNPSCAWDVTGCTGVAATCGNNTVEGGETCDGSDLNGYDCAAVGPFNGGTLACNANCQWFDYSGCTLTGPVCGNGVQEGVEQCDGADLSGMTCQSIGFDTGTLTCDANCGIDMSGCGWTAIPGWHCNAAFYGAGDGCDCGCGIVDPDCADATGASCAYCGETGSCNGPVDCADPNSIIDPANNAVCIASTCGNSLAEGSEQCDGPDLRAQDCETLGIGFSGGTLSCAAGCQFDLSLCVASVCGNSTQEGLEQCDDQDLQNLGCQDLVGFTGGTLACYANCQFDTSGCTEPICGDGTAEADEVCDGNDLQSETCVSLGQDFVGGTLGCNATCDDWDTSGCVSNICGDAVVAGAEECDGADLGMLAGAVCADFGFLSGSIACTASCTWDLSACDSGIAGWTCAPDWYNSGIMDDCDCGCGIVDPDCGGDVTVGACDYCDDFGSCSMSVANCPGNINPTDNSQCI